MNRSVNRAQVGGSFHVFSEALRVLYLLDSLNRGGVETLILSVCRQAQAVGIEPYLAGFGDGDAAAAFRDLPRSFFRTRHAPFDPFLARWLRQLVQTQRIALVHANQPVEALHAWWALRGLPVKLVLTLHNLEYDAKNRRALAFLLPRLDAVAVVSQAARQWHEASGVLRRIRPRRVAVVLNGVPEPSLSPRPPASPAAGPTLGMIANFTPIKDHATLCRALPDVFDRHPQARCLLAGAAQDRRLYREAQAMCERARLLDRVSFLGSCPAVEVLPRLDAFVLASRTDTFGLALVEAMLAGLPCVASDIPALREVTADGTVAALFRPGDAADCAHALNRVLSDAAYRHSLAARGQAHARRHYTLGAYLDRLRRFYDTVLGS
ncbi:glycosyltransferase family 4 protein [Chloracidobacterium validum]|uniref:Glycosyltransferase family 4 protein n=1 Tax=Chloracidobacterium validum TaxID=2821543 RepID=A0ABX8B4V3_9BACT|nr:glycosyltransferase family 4 protein [Chloracidobacterium validum]QUW02002.1 glycosyltransferase family 4 protein [Chloracidobacterium validum]